VTENQSEVVTGKRSGVGMTKGVGTTKVAIGRSVGEGHLVSKNVRRSASVLLESESVMKLVAQVAIMAVAETRTQLTSRSLACMHRACTYTKDACT
jgi:hypothetical protein